ncbi:AMP-binding protein [Nocardia africana]
MLSDDGRSYAEILLHTLAKNPDEIAVQWSGGILRRGDIVRGVTDTARALRARGVRSGAVVAVLAESNSPVMLVARYAANLLGAAVVYLRSSNAASSVRPLPVDQQSQLVAETLPRVLVTDDAHAEAGRALTDPHAGAIAVLAVGAQPVPGGADSGELPTGPAPFDPEELATITYTSGTTGRPKGICRSYRAWTHAIRTMAMSADTVLLVTTPLSHTVGPMADAALLCGARLRVLAGFTPEGVLDAIENDRVTRVFWATPQVYALLDHPRVAQADLSSLRTLMYGGIPASPARLRQAVELLGPVLVQSYGTTECWEICSLSPDDHRHPRLLHTVGRPSPGVSVVIRDLDTGRPAGDGEVGELCVRSDGVLTRYFGDPDRTAAVLRDGWYHTGDLGFRDPDGYLHLVDRAANMIKHNGVKVFPAEVQTVLTTHPAVAQAAVFGVRDADDVEHVYAVVVPRGDAEVDGAGLRDYVGTLMSPLHAPAAVEFRAELPTIGSGKIDVQRLRSEARPVG